MARKNFQITQFIFQKVVDILRPMWYHILVKRKELPEALRMGRQGIGSQHIRNRGGQRYEH